jgi:hypothetical protein
MRAGNFLSTLMDRAFNRVEVIERRRPSLFESASGFESALGVAPVDAPHPQEPDLESNLHDHPASAPQPLDIREPVAAPATHKMPLESAVASRVAASASEATSPVSSTPESRILKIAPEPEPRAAKTIIEKEVEKPRGSLHAQPPLPARHSAPTAEPPTGNSPSLQTITTNVVTVRAPARSTPDRGLEEKPRPPIREDQRSRIAPKAQAAEVSPRPRAAERALSSRQNTAPRETPRETTIQVTIGRIEIRAITAASATSRTARLAGPKLQLEDYLQSRKGNGK